MFLLNRKSTRTIICYYFISLMTIIVSVVSLNTILQRSYHSRSSIQLHGILRQSQRQSRELHSIRRGYLLSDQQIRHQRRKRYWNWMASSTTTDQDPQQGFDADNRIHPLVGGTYVGLYATFDASNGKHIPIDERYIPSSLLEWGYPPSTLETLVCESIERDRSQTSMRRTVDNADIPTHHTTAVITSMTRSIATILPATGCDNDNLETLSSPDHWTKGHTVFFKDHQQTIDVPVDKGAGDSTQSVNQSTDTVPESSLLPSMDFITTIHNKKLNQYGIETCFRWTPPYDKKDVTNHEQHKPLDDVEYRIRVNIDFERIRASQVKNIVGNAPTDQDHQWKLLNPIGVSLERKIAKSSNDTTINEYINGGGLDSRTVSQWIGSILKTEAMRSFPKTMVNKNPFVLPSNDNRNAEYVIPGNITISLSESASDQFMIEIGHIIGQSQVAVQNMDCDTSARNDIDLVETYHRLVISYNISISTTKSFETSSIILSNTNSNTPFSVDVQSRLEKLPRLQK